MWALFLTAEALCCHQNCTAYRQTQDSCAEPDELWKIAAETEKTQPTVDTHGHSVFTTEALCCHQNCTALRQSLHSCSEPDELWENATETENAVYSQQRHT